MHSVAGWGSGATPLAIEIAAVVGGLCEQLGIETLKLPCLPGR